MIIEQLHTERRMVQMGDNGRMTVKIPMTLKKHGGKKYILTQEDAQLTYQKPQQYEPLVAALLKAYHWKEKLDNGEHGSITELAHKQKVNERYAMKLLRMTLLAPDIVKAILDGKQPRHLTVMDVLKTTEGEWCAQRKRLGFPPVD